MKTGKLISSGAALLFLSSIVLTGNENQSNTDPVEWIEFTTNFTGIAGASTGEVDDLGFHEHDPSQEIGIQGWDVALNFRPTETVQGFVNVNIFTVGGDELEAEWEEGFLKWMPADSGLEFRAGAFLNRFGLENNKHLHAWEFVDASLSTSQLLGEEGLTTEGFEANWAAEVQEFTFALTASYGHVRQHSHEDHGHDEEEHEEEEEHDDEEHEEEHGHSESVENAYFSENVFSLRALTRYQYNDFHQHQAGLNFATGDNGFGRTSSIGSIDYLYTWRENGLEAGGQSIRGTAEYFYRLTDWETEGRLGDASQHGFLASVAYDWNPNWTIAGRFDWLEGAEETPFFDDGELEYGFEAESLSRLSLALTHSFELTSKTRARLRLQYNLEDRQESGSENSIWLQLNIAFGGSEIR